MVSGSSASATASTASSLIDAAVSLSSMAFPLAVMLASLMTFGNMGERYEIVALKSAGISTRKMMTPLAILTVFITIFSFFVSDQVIPRATLKLRLLLFDIQEQKPALNIEEGVFYNGFDNYSILVGKKMPDGETCTYTPNDMSAADLDGDGEYELILKWDPSNAHDNSQTGYTGTVFIDAYKLDGTRLWRIDLGKNIRAGAHYTQFQVFDYDGDGKAEMIVKTADGTIDGTGKAIGDKSKDYRDDNGIVLQGPEYLTVFRGADGAAITTITYTPSRDINQHVKGKNGKGYWGDNYGNRCERYIAATGYLDGVHPSAIFIRGYYSSSYVVAYDFDGKELKQRWYHKSEDPGKGLYEQGNHNITVGDIDGDGYDDVTTINLSNIGNGYTAKIHIYDSRGRPVKTLVNCKNIADQSHFVWNGLDDNGNIVPIGIYVVFIEVFDLQGDIKRFKKAVVVAAK